MQDELKKAKAEAEAAAAKILADAQARAANILGSAKPPSSSSAADEKAKEEEAARNAMLLKPVGTTGDNPKLDPKQLGLAPVMSIDTNLIKHAHELAKKADARHYKFEDEHEVNCKGPICPKA
jgi:regulator of protease activity HflC (stomatin/prohibitin superfamily)